MAWSDWNEPCTICEQWFDARHGEYVEHVAVTGVGEYTVCDTCKPIMDLVVKRVKMKHLNNVIKEE